MEENRNEKRITVTPEKDAIAMVSAFVDSCVEEYEIPMRVGYSLNVVADEIVSNIVYYSKAGTAGVLLRNAADTVTLVFTDDGIPYDPLEAGEPDVTAGVEDRQIGGLGLFMVKKMAEEVRYEYADGKNQLTVVLSKAGKKKKLSLEDF